MPLLYNTTISYFGSSPSKPPQSSFSTSSQKENARLQGLRSSGQRLSAVSSTALGSINQQRAGNVDDSDASNDENDSDHSTREDYRGREAGMETPAGRRLPRSRKRLGNEVESLGEIQMLFRLVQGMSNSQRMGVN